MAESRSAQRGPRAAATAKRKAVRVRPKRTYAGKPVTRRAVAPVVRSAPSAPVPVPERPRAAPAAVPVAPPPTVQPVPAPRPAPENVAPVPPRTTAPPVKVAPPAPPVERKPADPLPTEPSPTPPRPDPLPAPPNRVNVTPPKSASGGIVSARPPAQGHLAIIEPLTQSASLKSSGGTAETIGTRLDQARRLLSLGKVIEARMVLQLLLPLTPGPALHVLGRTYDPFYLGQLPRIDDGSEPRRAVSLYEEAISHGMSSAGADLDRLRSSPVGVR